MQARQRLVGIELFYHDLGVLLEFVRIILGPPIGEIAGRIELAAFVIEAMRDLVPDRSGRCIAVHQISVGDVRTR